LISNGLIRDVGLLDLPVAPVEVAKLAIVREKTRRRKPVLGVAVLEDHCLAPIVCSE
jgi:hypothetical protein